MKRGETDMNINEEFKLEMLEAKDKEVIDRINSYFRENEMNYEVVKLYKKSNRKNDLSLYVVVAELANTQKICSMDFLERFQKMSESWTLWNHINRALYGSG